MKNSDEQALIKEAQKIVHSLQALAQAKKLSVQILGPAEPMVQKIKNIFSRKIFFKSTRFADITTIYHLIETKSYCSSLFFTPNPLQ